MSWARWRVVLLTVTVAASATATAVAAAGDSNEELNQALVLVEILKSGINRRTPFPVTKMANVLPLNYYEVLGRAWPPPYDVPYYEYGGRGKMAPLFSPKPYYGPLPQRRYENGFVEGVSSHRRVSNASRQNIENDYEFGQQPDNNESDTNVPENKIPLKNETENPKPNFNNTQGTTITTISKKTENKTTIKAEDPKKESSATTKNDTNVPGNRVPLKNESEKPTTKKSPATAGSDTNVPGKRVPLKHESEKTATKKSSATTKSDTHVPGNRVPLKHASKKNNTKDSPGTAGMNNQTNENDLEIAQAAKELERETKDLRETSQHSKYLCRTTKSDHSKANLCLGGACKQEKAKSTVATRFRVTTRVYLSRSSRPAIPLPENNAYCYTNPESPLCRTFI